MASSTILRGHTIVTLELSLEEAQLIRDLIGSSPGTRESMGIHEALTKHRELEQPQRNYRIIE